MVCCWRSVGCFPCWLSVCEEATETVTSLENTSHPRLKTSFTLQARGGRNGKNSISGIFFEISRFCASTSHTTETRAQVLFSVVCDVDAQNRLWSLVCDVNAQNRLWSQWCVMLMHRTGSGLWCVMLMHRTVSGLSGV